MSRILIGALLLVLVCSEVSLASEQDSVPVGATLEDYQWWRDARFGIFIHWGPGALIYKNGLQRAAPPADHPGYSERSYNAKHLPVPAEISNGEYSCPFYAQHATAHIGPPHYLVDHAR